MHGHGRLHPDPLVAIVAAAALAGCDAAAARRSPPHAARIAPVGRTVTLGRSVRGRPIVAVELRRAAPRMLVVGVIHSNERAGLGVVRSLEAGGGVPGLTSGCSKR